MRPVTAIAAPTGAIASERPSTRWAAEVKRLQRLYPVTMQSAAGESAAARGLIVAATATNSRALASTKVIAARGVTTPAGISRFAVRGFAAS